MLRIVARFVAGTLERPMAAVRRVTERTTRWDDGTTGAYHWYL